MTQLSPDQLRAMARVLDPEAFVDDYDPDRGAVQNDIDQHQQAAQAKALTAAKACWQASPGGGWMEALSEIDAMPFYTATVPAEQVRGLRAHYNKALEIAREALRQALPQGAET